MATRTPIHHPRQQQQTTQFYGFDFIVRQINTENGRFDIVVCQGKCAFAPAEGGAPATFQDEAAVSERVLIPAWHPEIKPKMHVKVSKGTWGRLFEILDVVPHGSAMQGTLLVVSTFQ